MPVTHSALQKPDKTFSVIECFAVVYFAHKLLPMFGWYMPAIAYLGVFAVLAVLLLPTLQSKMLGTMACTFAIAVLALVPKLSNLSELFLFVYGQLQFLVYGMITVYLITKKGVYGCRRMLLIIGAMYLVTAITTYISTFTYPLASRELATLSQSDAAYGFYTKKNIASFAFIYELVLITPLLICVARQKIIHPLIAYVLLAFVGITIIATEYGMAVLLFFASLLLLVIPRLTAKKLIILLIILLLIVVLFGGLLADGFETLSKSVDSETLAERFLTVAETLRGEDKLSDGTGSNRVELYKESWTTFVDSMFLGAWGKGSAGGHSYVLEALGFYGIVGLLALALIFYAIYALCLKPYRHESFYPYLLWMVLLLALLAFLNPKIYNFMFLCVIPLFAESFRTRGKEETV